MKSLIASSLAALTLAQNSTEIDFNFDGSVNNDSPVPVVEWPESTQYVYAPSVTGVIGAQWHFVSAKIALC
jgi:hypothetical protein